MDNTPQITLLVGTGYECITNIGQTPENYVNGSHGGGNYAYLLKTNSPKLLDQFEDVQILLYLLHNYSFVSIFK